MRVPFPLSLPSDFCPTFFPGLIFSTDSSAVLLRDSPLQGGAPHFHPFDLRVFPLIFRPHRFSVIRRPFSNHIRVHFPFPVVSCTLLPLTLVFTDPVPIGRLYCFLFRLFPLTVPAVSVFAVSLTQVSRSHPRPAFFRPPLTLSPPPALPNPPGPSFFDAQKSRLIPFLLVYLYPCPRTFISSPLEFYYQSLGHTARSIRDPFFFWCCRVKSFHKVLDNLAVSLTEILNAFSCRV